MESFEIVQTLSQIATQGSTGNPVSFSCLASDKATNDYLTNSLYARLPVSPNVMNGDRITIINGTGVGGTVTNVNIIIRNSVGNIYGGTGTLSVTSDSNIFIGNGGCLTLLFYNNNWFVPGYNIT